MEAHALRVIWAGIHRNDDVGQGKRFRDEFALLATSIGSKTSPTFCAIAAMLAALS
jgi:hypothetical protein